MSIIGFVGCSAQKKNIASPAKDLYISPLFKKSRYFVEKNCDKWFILSAKYGLLSPEQIVEPYNETLKSYGVKEKTAWAELVFREIAKHIHPGDKIVFLAGKSYRQLLIPKLQNLGVLIEIPMKDLEIGKQLHYLNIQNQRKNIENDIDLLYKYLSILESGLHGKRLFKQCNGKQSWPPKGVYFVYEPNEFRFDKNDLRVVRVGTHAVNLGAKSTLWGRLRTHKGTLEGSGSHRSSILRFHVGEALMNKYPDLYTDSWGKKLNTLNVNVNEIKSKEQKLEQKVSEYIGSMSVLYLSITDDASSSCDRAYIEKNTIVLLSCFNGNIDRPSDGWLGLYSKKDKIRESGLWNINYVQYNNYSPDYLDIFKEYVSITLGKIPNPNKSLAPINWNSDNEDIQLTTLADKDY
ncbi:MAG TPA: hypothetical protein PLF50_05935 [Candidatus Cloacimonadota bacterium]|nr:hypothetical protein [Candidatus Cloacimonadota bacterium]